MKTLVGSIFWIVAFLFSIAPFILVGYGVIAAIGSGFFGDGRLVKGALVATILGIVWGIANRYTLNHPK